MASLPLILAEMGRACVGFEPVFQRYDGCPAILIHGGLIRAGRERMRAALRRDYSISAKVQA
jgi:hypothetical protein